MADSTTPTAKPWWQSKTVWINILALVTMAVPAVREWVEKNPVEPLAVLTALNLLVRFVTSGRITIFPEGDDSGSGSSAGAGVSGGKAGSERDSAADMSDGKRHTSGFPWLVGPACVVLLSGCVVGVDEAGNYSVRPDPYSIDAVLKHAIRHDDDSAKCGLKRTNPTPQDLRGASRGDAKAAEVNAEK